MRLADFRMTQDGGRVKAAATVCWEDCDQPRREVFIETSADFASDLRAEPHSFLVGCLVPALHFGERRIALNRKICPTLMEGLKTAMAVLSFWSKDTWRPLVIEAHARRRPRHRRQSRRTALFLSGGIDSLAALQISRRTHPFDHPDAIQDGLVVHGFDIGGVVRRGMKYPVFHRALESLKPVARDARLDLIPVWTNFRHLCDDRDLWLNRFFGAVLAAVGHAFSSRVRNCQIASSYDLPHLHPCGSHPLLDPFYSSHEMRILHRDLELSRIEKIRQVLQWDAAFQNLRVCLANVPDRLNCGRCEKCVRTMLALVALGVLQKTRAFAEDDITPEYFSAFSIRIRERAPFYRELLPLLARRGRQDLVQAITFKLQNDPTTSPSPPQPAPKSR